MLISYRFENIDIFNFGLGFAYPNFVWFLTSVFYFCAYIWCFLFDCSKCYLWMSDRFERIAPKKRLRAAEISLLL